MTLKKYNDKKSELEQKYRSVAGFTLLFDNEDYIWEPKDWTEEIAVALAKECGILSLDERHWKVIRFMRDYYFTYGRAPLNSQLKDRI